MKDFNIEKNMESPLILKTTTSTTSGQVLSSVVFSRREETIEIRYFPTITLGAIKLKQVLVANNSNMTGAVALSPDYFDKTIAETEATETNLNGKGIRISNPSGENVFMKIEFEAITKGSGVNVDLTAIILVRSFEKASR